jgi:hypothetical protein
LTAQYERISDEQRVCGEKTNIVISFIQATSTSPEMPTTCVALPLMLHTLPFKINQPIFDSSNQTIRNVFCFFIIHNFFIETNQSRGIKKPILARIKILAPFFSKCLKQTLPRIIHE